MVDEHYTFGSQKDGQDHDNRFDYRLTARARAIIELNVDELSAPGAAQQTHSLPIVDLSASGLSLWSTRTLSVGALMPAIIKLGDGQPDYKLMLEIVWCRPASADATNATNGNSGYLLGCRVIEADGNATVEWLEAVAAAMLNA